jgi:ABC-type multidrug transport system fused ATPase/permease subunit
LVLNDNAIENIEEFIDTISTLTYMKNQFDEFQYIEDLIKYRLNQSLSNSTNDDKPELPKFEKWHTPLAKFIKENELSEDAAVLLLIAFIPHIQSDLFDRIIQQFLHDSGDFPKLGGVRGKNSRTFLPTGETALFLIAGDDWKQKIVIQNLFGAEHIFETREILWLEDLPIGEPVMSGRILSQEYVELFSLGHSTPPKFSSNFPAQLINTSLKWNDVVLNPETKQQIEEIESWANYGNKMLIDWNLKDKIKPGFRALFYGPPGTGKTLTASLIGNLTSREVYKISPVFLQELKIKIGYYFLMKPMLFLVKERV